MHSASGLGGVFVLFIESQFKTMLLLSKFTFCETREYQFIRMQKIKNFYRGSMTWAKLGGAHNNFLGKIHHHTEKYRYNEFCLND